ncbi:MAG: TonB-dependent receptor [Bacteroidales bacterium]|nr:TonB-dependent receptor [Bacteroidales bacterium]
MRKLISIFTVSFCALLFSFAAMAQHRVSGVITDPSGQPVIGAAVLSADKSVGEVSDVDGKFTVTIGDKPVELTVSCLGYTTQTITVRPTQGSISIIMEEDSFALSETVVVGYGSQKKSNLTGALTVVEASQLSDRSALDVGHMLQGVVPGLTISATSGRPGQDVDINIRGVNSINGGDPLVLIDGVEGSMLRVNPNDVESISVIKDAAAAAIYGARASFGVILVTTKSGSAEDGKPTISYSGRVGFKTPTTSTEYETSGYWSVYTNNLFWKAYDGKAYANYTDEDMEELWARRNDKVENPARPWVTVTNENGEDVYNYYANTDWYHWMYRDVAPTTSHSVSLSGGAKNVKYFISGNFSQDEGMIKENPDVYKRYNLRSKVTMDITKWLNVSNNTAFFTSTYSYPGISGVNNSFYNIRLHALASYPTQNPDGTAIYSTKYNNYTVGDGAAVYMGNPNFRNLDKSSEISNTFEMTIHPVKQFELKANYTYSQYNKNNMNRTVETTCSDRPGVITEMTKYENKLTEAFSVNRYHAVNVYGTYSDTFADAHNLKAMLGFNYETKHNKDVEAYGWNLMSDTLNDLDLTGTDDEGNKRTDVGGGQSEYAIAGFFGRINYDYKGKYLLELSGRYDGTSRFSSASRWGFFPSGSAGWKISEEDFFAPLRKTVNLAKIRYSYGQLGNQQVGYYDYIRSVTIKKGDYLFGGDKPVVASLGWPVAGNLTWEVTSQHNIGIDLGMLNNRLNFTGEFYIRDTKNMLTDGMALPAVYGAEVPQMNAADLRTKGYELSLSWKDQFSLFGHPFHYNVTAVFNDFTSKITRFANPTKNLNNYYEGMTLGEIWGYHVDGFFKTDEEAQQYMNAVDLSVVADRLTNTPLGGWWAGDMKYVDLDGSGKLDDGAGTADNPGDRRIIGNSQPRFQYGLTLGFNYFNFDFSIFLQGVGHQDWYPGGEAELFWGPFCRPYATLMIPGFLNECWSEENPNAFFPRPRGYIALGTRALTIKNDKYLQDIGFCRVKNITFGYTLPKKVLDKIKMKQLRVYFTGENLGFIANNLHFSKYIDPELCAAQSNLANYRWQKTFMFGVDITF